MLGLVNGRTDEGTSYSSPVHRSRAGERRTPEEEERERKKEHRRKTVAAFALPRRHMGLKLKKETRSSLSYRQGEPVVAKRSFFCSSTFDSRKTGKKKAFLSKAFCLTLRQPTQRKESALLFPVSTFLPLSSEFLQLDGAELIYTSLGRGEERRDLGNGLFLLPTRWWRG